MFDDTEKNDLQRNVKDHVQKRSIANQLLTEM